MNVEIGTVAGQFPEKQYLFRIFGVGSLQCAVRTPKISTVHIQSLVSS
jgi:hypothetical protein